jgi:hypothetical protein
MRASPDIAMLGRQFICSALPHPSPWAWVGAEITVKNACSAYFLAWLANACRMGSMGQVVAAAWSGCHRNVLSSMAVVANTATEDFARAVAINLATNWCS